MSELPSLEVLIVWDEDEGKYVVCEDSVHDGLHDLCADTDVDVHAEDVGIGSYEYWGSRGYDSRIEVTEIDGELEFRIEPNVELSEADTRSVSDGTNPDILKAKAVWDALTSFKWPSVRIPGTLESERRGLSSLEYVATWRRITADPVSFQVRYGAS